MDIIFVTGFVTLFAVLWLGAAWLDKQHGWRLVDWMEGNCRHPFGRCTDSPVKDQDKDKTIAELKARIEVLEKVVTEPAYELNKKINRL